MQTKRIYDKLSREKLLKGYLLYFQLLANENVTKFNGLCLNEGEMVIEGHLHVIQSSHLATDLTLQFTSVERTFLCGSIVLATSVYSPPYKRTQI